MLSRIFEKEWMLNPQKDKEYRSEFPSNLSPYTSPSASIARKRVGESSKKEGASRTFISCFVTCIENFANYIGCSRANSQL